MKGALEDLTPTSRGAYWSKNIGNCAIYVAENTGGGFGLPRELEKTAPFRFAQGAYCKSVERCICQHFPKENVDKYNM